MATETSSVQVTFVSAYSELGGSEGYVETLLKGLGPAWTRSVVLLERGDFEQRLDLLGVPVTVIDAPGRRAIARAAWRLRHLVSKEQPDVIHANGAKAALVSVAATVRTPVPVIWSKVDGSLDGPRARLLARGCDQVVGISRSTVATFDHRLLPKVCVVYPGIPDQRLDPAGAREMVLDLLELPGDARVLVLSGRLCPPKGQAELLEIAPMILARFPEARFAFLGGESRGYPGYERELRERANALGLSDRVAFLGHRSESIRSVADAVRFVSGCDLLVAPSRAESTSGWKEGFGLAAVEAMSVGTPVVGYRHGSLPEVLGDCALLVPEGDRARLGEAIISVLSDRALGQRMRRCGRARAARYSVAAAIEGMKQRYRESALRAAGSY